MNQVSVNVDESTLEKLWNRADRNQMSLSATARLAILKGLQSGADLIE